MNKHSSGPPETRSLIDRAKAGDDRAIEVLYARYIRRVEAWTRGRVPARARDLENTHTVAHDVLVRTLLKATDEDHPITVSFRAYVFRSVRNHLINIGVGAREFTSDLTDEFPSGEPTELEKLLETEFESRVMDCIRELPLESRELLDLRFKNGLRYREIAERTGLGSEDAARMKTNRVLLQLRCAIESSE